MTSPVVVKQSALVPRPAPRPQSSDLTTPQWLKGSLVLSWALAGAFVWISVAAVHQHGTAITTIAENSAKSVIAAERIASSLADMDARAVNGLLVPQKSDDSSKAYQQARKELAAALVDASHNITFQGEEKLMRTLTEMSSVYDSRVQAAYTLQTSGAGGAISQYNQAANILDKELMPAARALDKINRDELDNSYTSIQGWDGKLNWLVRIGGLALIAVLLRIQFFLSDKMRRTLNPLLLIATLIASGLLLYTEHALRTASEETKTLKVDSFESVHALWRAKAVAYQANAEESRYLFDKANAATHLANFQALAAQMSDNPRKLLEAGERQQKPDKSYTGYLADEFRNITFAGERESAAQALSFWKRYVDIDEKIRTLESSGQHQKAIELCMGEGMDQSNWAFNGFTKHLTDTLDINQKEFDRAEQRGLQVLKNFQIASPIAALIAALCALIGLLPRIREYSA